MSESEIIERFKSASIVIKKSECKKSHKNMIVTIHSDYGIKFFSSYYSAFCFYIRTNLI